MKKHIIFVIIFGCITMSSWATISLPWDSVFASYGLNKNMTIIPLLISEDIDIFYKDDNCAGFWGLTLPVARHYGLTVNDKIDERYDLRLASETAARYLRDLVDFYGDEDLARLAYLNGAALLNDVARMYDVVLSNISKESFDVLCEHMPKKVICENVIEMGVDVLDSVYNHTGYVMYKFKHPIRTRTLIDSLCRDERVFYLQNSKILPTSNWVTEAFISADVDLEDMEMWLSCVYDSENEAMQLENKEFEDEIKRRDEVRAAAIKKANAVKEYYVKSGDTLGHIAKRYKVSVRQIKQWNNLKSDFLRVGQKLKIHTI